jgi:hypothetical protein
MLKKAIFATALALGFVTSFHMGRAADGTKAIQVDTASTAAACPDSCDDWGCVCACWGC